MKPSVGVLSASRLKNLLEFYKKAGFCLLVKSPHLMLEQQLKRGKEGKEQAFQGFRVTIEFSNIATRPKEEYGIYQVYIFLF